MPHVPQAIPVAYPAGHQAAPQPPPVGVPTGVPLNMQGLPCAPSFSATTTGVLLNVQGLPTGVHSNGLPCAPFFNTSEEEYNPPPPRPAEEEEATQAQGVVYTQGEVYSGGGLLGWHLPLQPLQQQRCAQHPRGMGVLPLKGT